MTPHQLKYRAHLEVCKAIAAGRLGSQPCEVCGALPERVNGRNVIEAHHHKGYAEEYWLDIQWLCCPCHRSRHRRHGASNRILRKLSGEVLRLDLALARRDEAVIESGRCSSEMRRLGLGLEG